MRLLQTEVTNFGSYPHLAFTYIGRGLSLVYGPTGSGKSTFQDIPAWILYGVTSKDGNADDIIPWNSTSSTDQPPVTTGSLLLEISPGVTLTIYRTRGHSSNRHNDLYWIEHRDSVPKRGKDMPDTQRLLEKRLGVSKDLYITSAYFNEFSPTGSFFTAKAKDRRDLFDKLADLSLPLLIAEKVSTHKKEIKKILQSEETAHNQSIGTLKQLIDSDKSSKEDSLAWESNQQKLLSGLKSKYDNFEQEKQRRIDQLKKQESQWELYKQNELNKLGGDYKQLMEHFSHLPPEICPACSQPSKLAQQFTKTAHDISKNIEKVTDTVNRYTEAVKNAELTENKYLEQLEIEKIKSNPFLKQLQNLKTKIPETETKISSIVQTIASLKFRNSSLEQIQDLSTVLRAELLRKSIRSIEESTNRYLTSYFNSEMGVVFELDKDSDELLVKIYKNGYACHFRQLSKGQRGLLKLCFSVSVMETASNKTGVHFDTIMFDEALDGLDSDFKIKAFGLFQELSLRHESIFVVDHSQDFHNMFDTKFKVSLVSDASQVE